MAKSWDPRTVRFWTQLASTPPATMWGTTEWTLLEALLPLLDHYFDADRPPVSTMSEVRHVLDALGCTPSARARLGWVMPDEAPAGEAPQESAPRRQARRRKDPRTTRALKAT